MLYDDLNVLDMFTSMFAIMTSAMSAGIEIY